jgi:uracil-DNA glycosylase family 4
VVSLSALREEVVACRRCPRLVAYRESVKPRPSFSGQDYWRRPVPGFGDINGRVLVLGIAPALHGGNRTGRVFTGDSSGRFLVKALYKGGFASQPSSESVDDGLVYRDCYVTAAVKCAPPGDRPSPEEFANCSEYLEIEIKLMKKLRAVLALGALSFMAYLEHLKASGIETRGLSFEHGRVYRVDGSPTIYASYHPSPRNTNTGKLTEEMLVRIVKRIRSDLQRYEVSPKDN